MHHIDDCYSLNSCKPPEATADGNRGSSRKPGSLIGWQTWPSVETMDLGINGRVALVVGGTGYIGAAVAARLRAEGATVVTAGRSSGDVHLDATDDASVAAGVTSVVEQHGRIDLLVHAAAPPAGSLDPSMLSDPGAVEAGIAAKSLTFLRMANTVLPLMREAGFGRVVGISGQNAYTTGNLLGMVRNVDLIVIAKSLADAYAGSGVTVNVVNPATVTDHPSTEVTVGAGGESSPADIAALVAFLCSESAGRISGESIASGHKLRGIATS